MRDTIDLAREAGLEISSSPPFFVKAWEEELKTFADLVRADEREACAKLCVKIALEFKSMYCGDEMEAALICEETIRARGETK